MLVALLPLGAVAVWKAVLTRRELLKVAEQSLLVHAQNTVEAIEAYLGERRLDAQQMALNPLAIRAVGKGARLTGTERSMIRSRLEADRRSYGCLRLALVQADGGMLVSLGGPIPTHGPESRKTLHEAIGGGPVVSDPFFAGPGGSHILELAAPVRDTGGAARGVVLCALPFDGVAAIVRADTARAGPGSAGELVDGNMIRIAHGSDPNWVGLPVLPLPTPFADALIQAGGFRWRTVETLGSAADTPGFPEHIAALRQQGLGVSPFFDVLPVGPRYQWSRAVVVILRTKPWAYGLAVPYAVLLAPGEAQPKNGLITMALAVGAAALLAWWLGGILSQRLARVAEVGERIAAGDFTVRAEGGPADEIGRLAQSFNIMAHALQKREAARRDRLARLEGLLSMRRHGNASLDLAQVLYLELEKSVHAMGVDAAAILAADPKDGSLRVIQTKGVPSGYVPFFTLGPGEGPSGRALEEGKPVWTADLQADPRFPLKGVHRTLVALAGIRAALAVPIRTPSSFCGVLTLCRRQVQPFSPDQVRFATLLADQAGTAIENARLHEQHSAQMVGLSEVLRRLDITQPVEAFLRDLTEAVRQAIGARYAALGVIGPDGDLAQFIAVGLTPEEMERIGWPPRALGLIAHMLRTPDPLRLDDVSKHPESSGFPPHHPPMRTFLGMRIAFQDRVIGALFVTEKAGGGPFAAADEQLLEAFAATAAMAIASAQAYRELQKAKQELEAKSKECLFAGHV
ncbi:MAG: GAF domain-containing protein [Elusimicrobia bacterium]|nr:GAF domain-containing protein [Elusimicrobiota bacterium]